jgi:hypothetical protein
MTLDRRRPTRWFRLVLSGLTASEPRRCLRRRELLRGVEARFHRLDEFATTHLHLLESEHCESDCGVADLGCLLHDGGVENCRGSQAAKVDRREVDRVQLREGNLRKIDLREGITTGKVDLRKGDFRNCELGERSHGRNRTAQCLLLLALGARPCVTWLWTPAPGLFGRGTSLAGA